MAIGQWVSCAGDRVFWGLTIGTDWLSGGVVEFIENMSIVLRLNGDCNVLDRGVCGGVRHNLIR
jgi:hypothetical protein